MLVTNHLTMKQAALGNQFKWVSMEEDYSARFHLTSNK